MGQEISTFGDNEIEKDIFYQYKSPIFLEDIDINSVLVSNKIFSGGENHQQFIGCLHDDYKIKPLHLMLSKMRAFVKRYDVQTKWIHFQLKMMNYWKSVILFGIKSPQILKICVQ